MRIQRIGLFSAGKMVGAVSALLTLFGSALWLLAGTAFAGLSAAATVEQQTDAAAALLPFAVGSFAVVIIWPVTAGIVGFVQGLVGALFYNVIAGVVGGIRIEVE